jgi:hypothetical protein
LERPDKSSQQLERPIWGLKASGVFFFVHHS